MMTMRGDSELRQRRGSSGERPAGLYMQYLQRLADRRPTACALPLKLKKGTFGESRWQLKTTSYITGFLMSRYRQMGKNGLRDPVHIRALGVKNGWHPTVAATLRRFDSSGHILFGNASSKRGWSTTKWTMQTTCWPRYGTKNRRRKGSLHRRPYQALQ
jgi:hypothetical protein